MRENSKKQSKVSAKKIVFVIFSIILFAFPGTKKAQAWDAMAATIYKQTSEEISYTIKGVTMGALKQAAIRTISRQMDIFISGTSRSGARFITNWEDYLIKNPTRNAQRYANDYVSRALSGRGSVSYRKSRNSVLGASTIANEGFGKEAVLGVLDAEYATDDESYASSIQRMAQEDIIDKKEWYLTYHGDPKTMFDGNNLSEFNGFVLGNNTIWDAKNAIEKNYKENLENEEKIAETQSIAYSGYKGEKTEEGDVTKPGILYKELEANIENLPNLAMVSATNVQELIAATVSRAISGVFNRTVSGVERAVNREITNVTRKTTQEISRKVNEFGPGSLYRR